LTKLTISGGVIDYLLIWWLLEIHLSSVFLIYLWLVTRLLIRCYLFFASRLLYFY